MPSYGFGRLLEPAARRCFCSRQSTDGLLVALRIMLVHAYNPIVTLPIFIIDSSAIADTHSQPRLHSAVLFIDILCRRCRLHGISGIQVSRSRCITVDYTLFCRAYACTRNAGRAVGETSSPTWMTTVQHKMRRRSVSSAYIRCGST